MTKVTYVGPGPGVRLAPVHGDIWLPHGEPVDLPAALAASLAQQPQFKVTRGRVGANSPDSPHHETPEALSPLEEARPDGPHRTETR